MAETLDDILEHAFVRMRGIDDTMEKGRTFQFLSFMCKCPDSKLFLKALKAAADLSCEASDADRQFMLQHFGTGDLIRLTNGIIAVVLRACPLPTPATKRYVIR